MTDLEIKLFQLLEAANARADGLEALLLQNRGLLETEQTIIAAESPLRSGVGKKPWYIQKKLLERSHASKIEEAIQSDAGSSTRGDNGERNPEECRLGIRAQDAGSEETKVL